jgi:hypothetical protein
MITAAEYRAWADESLKWAHEAATESEREACTKSAEVWLQSVLRSERRSKGPNITTEHVWQLPPFKSGGARALQLKLPTAMDRCETLSTAQSVLIGCVAVPIMRTSDPLKSLAVWSVEELETP